MNKTKQAVYDWLVVGVRPIYIGGRIFKSHSTVEKYSQQIYKENKVADQVQLIAKHYLGAQQFRKYQNGTDTPTQTKPT